MNNKLFFKIRKTCEDHQIELVDAELRMAAFHLDKLNQLYYNKSNQKPNQKGGNNIDNHITRNLNKCLNPLFILENGNKDTVKHILNNLITGNYNGLSFICSKYKK